MERRPPRSTRTYTLFPAPTLFRSRVPAGRARRDRLRVVRRVLERQVRIVEPVHRAELVAQVDAGLVVGQVGGKVRRTDGTARRDRVLVTVAQAQLEQAGVAGLETQLAEVELLVERHVVRSVLRAELRRPRIGVEHIRPRHVARHDEILETGSATCGEKGCKYV